MQFHKPPPPDPYSGGFQHFIGCFVGRPRSGKTWMAAQYAHQLQHEGKINKIYLVSPTAHSNGHLWFDYLGINPQDAFVAIDEAPRAFEECINRIRSDHNRYVMNLEHWNAYRRFTKGKPLTDREMRLLEGYNGRPPLEELDQPSPLIILDDLQASSLLNANNRVFTSTILRHRHIASNPRQGVSLMILTQTLRGGLPRTLRSCVNLWCVWRTEDTTQKKDLFQEVAGVIKWQPFVRMIEFATSGEDFPYLVIDTAAPKGQTFKRKLDGEFLRPEDFVE